MRIQDPEGLRANDAHPVCPGPTHQLVLAGESPLAVVGESGSGHHKALDAGSCAVVNYLVDLLIRNGDDGQLNRPRDLGQFPEGDHSGEFERFRVDGVDRTFEAAFDDVLQQLVAHRPPLAAGTDNSHRRRRQQVAHAARLRAVLP
ncbi:hypothetical protein D3C73_1089890 [compost metagenome]